MENVFTDFHHVEDFFSFLANIDWRDPWLIGLFAFHVSIFMMAVLTRNYGNFQALLFFVLLLMVYFSEYINQLASSNWHIFSRQQYFDDSGHFISIVFSMPILLNCILMVGSWLYQSTQLMKNLKMAQIKAELRKRNSDERKKSKSD
ncbi:transmembrane protein 18 [Cylas formicarius]|uniref:transmembrane protein 18 n=1 Tax=Cylas formicarius TaxID=197179 RepID=UPI0029583D10|nr:transmembrane protein 18 [Cylas formicarius]